MKKIGGLLITLVFVATSAQASTYKWVDDQGTLNFTEDPGNIPKKYRKNARIVTEEEPAADEAENKETGSGVKPQEKAPDPVAAQGTAPTEKQDKKKAVYGGKDATVWKSEFSRLRSELKTIDEQLGSKRTLFSDPSKLSRTQYKSLQYEIKNLEQLWNDLAAKLKSLRADATREGVPLEFQQ